MKKIILFSMLASTLLTINNLKSSAMDESNNKCDELYRALKATAAHYHVKKDGDFLGDTRLKKALSEAELFTCEKSYNQDNSNKVNTVMFPDGGIFFFAKK